MKRISAIATLVLLVASTPGAFADFPIRQSARNDASPVVAYNSTDHEYLVVWAEEFLIGSVLYNSVRAQRVAENGAMIGNLFTVITFAANPAVTYNSAANEYLVGGNPGGNYVCQRVSNTGTLVGSAVTLMNGVNHARLLYNSLGGHYLAVGAALEETPAGSGTYNVKIYSCNVSANLQTVSTPLLIENRAHGPQTLEPAFGVAFAPMITPETINGRYLLAVGRGVVLVMLDSDGAPIDVVYDPAHPGVRYRYIPFNTGNPSAGEFHVDVAYGDHSGYSMSGPAFLVVWADQNNKWNGQSWSGIWGGFVDAGKIEYATTDPVLNTAFPISAIADHWAYDPHVESWRPKVAFNPSSQKFYVVWRETPGTSPYNNTTVNHIRANQVFERIPATNVIVSATAGTEDPTYPALAASTTSEMALVAWQDYRNGASTKWDIFGSIQKVGDPVIVSPSRHEVTHIFDHGPGSLRQAILDANARPGRDTITFNIPGSGPHAILPSTALPPLTGPVLIDGYTQPGSKTNSRGLSEPSDAVLKIIIDGSGLTQSMIQADGLCLRAGNSIVRGLVVNAFPGAGLLLEGTGGNVIEGNYIGTNEWGMMRRDNEEGVVIRNIPDNLVGGTTPAARNVISGNKGEAGVLIEHSGARGNLVQGNFISINAAGTAALANRGCGVYIAQAPGNTVGGLISSMRNVIAGTHRGSDAHNSASGNIVIHGDTAAGNLVAGNLIGTNATGDAAVENDGANGVALTAPGNTVGGTVQGARNIISGNNLSGVILEACAGNVIQGNYIGTDVTGAKAIDNGRVAVGAIAGVDLWDTDSTLIGGRSPGAGNVISGNWCYGVAIEVAWTQGGRGNRVEGNMIGVQADGTSPLGNGGAGVCYEGHKLSNAGNSIGGTVNGAGNTIAFNGGDGVLVKNIPGVNDGPVGARISGNAIYANGGIGINLVGGTEDAQGVTANDPGDGDIGPNNLQNYPVITSGEGGSYLSLQATLNSTPSTKFELDVYATPSSDATSYGEGQTLLGYSFVTTDATGNASFSGTIGTPVGIGQAITMTATDPEGNTSEFSAPVVVTATSGDDVVTNTLDSGPGSLRQAILNVNAKTGGGKVVFGIPGSGPHTIRPITPLPPITKTVRIDGYTQPGSSVNTLPFASGTNAVLKIEIDGTNLGSEHNGLCICGGNSVVRGLVVNRFGSVGIRLQTKGGNRVEGCFLGTDVAGMSQLGNYTGVMITEIGYNWIGGTTAAQRNVIAGNKRGVTIGGEASTKNEVQGNYIGTNASGSAPLGNDDAGVLLISAVSNTIGGFADRAANVISGSGRGSQDVGAGIQIQGSPDQKGQWNSVLGNLIGTNAAGDAQLANFMRGIVILSSRGNIIGGMERGEGNVISGCALSGVYLESWGGDAVLGNRIGTDITGTKAIGNAEGIVVRFSDSVSIGGADSACANIIAYNTGQGIRVEEFESQVMIRRNSIFSNGGIGIDLDGGPEDSRHWTENDPRDADTGPNDLQNYPEILGATGGDKLVLTGRLNSRPNARFTLDFYLTPTSTMGGFGEGKEYLACKDVQTDAFGNASFNLTINKSVSAKGFITATATDSSGNTSEFSAPVAVTVTSVSPKDVLPREAALMQNYPNPFNPTTIVSFQLPVVSDVKLEVFDVLGRQVSVLVNERKDAGYHDVTFEASKLAAGVYFYRLEAHPATGCQVGDFAAVKKLLFAK